MTQHCCHFARMAACLSGPILSDGIVQPFSEQEDTAVCMVNHTRRDPGKADPQFIDASVEIVVKSFVMYILVTGNSLHLTYFNGPTEGVK